MCGLVIGVRGCGEGAALMSRLRAEGSVVGGLGKCRSGAIGAGGVAWPCGLVFVGLILLVQVLSLASSALASSIHEPVDSMLMEVSREAFEAGGAERE